MAVEDITEGAGREAGKKPIQNSGGRSGAARKVPGDGTPA
jgi:hypothetical protein